MSSMTWSSRIHSASAPISVGSRLPRCHARRGSSPASGRAWKRSRRSARPRLHHSPIGGRPLVEGRRIGKIEQHLAALLGRQQETATMPRKARRTLSSKAPPCSTATALGARSFVRQNRNSAGHGQHVCRSQTSNSPSARRFPDPPRCARRAVVHHARLALRSRVPATNSCLSTRNASCGPRRSLPAAPTNSYGRGRRRRCRDSAPVARRDERIGIAHGSTGDGAAEAKAPASPKNAGSQAKSARLPTSANRSRRRCRGRWPGSTCTWRRNASRGSCRSRRFPPAADHAGASSCLRSARCGWHHRRGPWPGCRTR